QHRALAPEAARRDLPAAERRRQRGRHLDGEGLEIGQRERPVLFPVELCDALCRLAAIELIARGANPGRATAAGALLGRRHARQRVAELALDEKLTGLERAAILQVERLRRLPA